MLERTELSRRNRRNRQSGGEFENRVRKDLEQKGFFASKFQSNIDLEKGILIPAKASRFRLMTTGFPDYIAWQNKKIHHYIIGVECKVKGYLSKEEKAKCEWLLKNKVFQRIFIAKKVKEKNRVKIIYKEFKVK